MSTQFTNRQWRLPNNENKDKQSNYSMDFDGTEYITGGTFSEYISSSNPTTLTVSAWIKTTDTGTSRGIISSAFYSSGLNFEVYNGEVFFGISGTTTTSTTTANVNDGNWHHVVGTYDSQGDASGNTLYIYVDGIQKASNTVVKLYIRNDPLFIGAKGAGSSTYSPFIGQIDAVSIFDYALSSSQVTTLYGSSSTGIGNPMSLSPKPVAYYPLGDQDAFNGADYLVPNIAAQEDDGDIATSYSPYALDFDRASVGSITTNADLSSYSNITVSTWARFVSATGFQYVFDAGTYNASGPAGIKLGISKTPTNEIVTYDGLTGHLTGSYVTLNTWYNITVTHTGTTRKAYLNGSLIGTFTSGSLNLNAINYIGRFSLNSNFMDGSISNVSIWNTALTSAQVTEIYNEGVPSNLNNHSAYSNLVSWWQLGSNSSFNTNWTVLDEKGSNNGTSVNMTEADIVDGVGSYANGVSSGMSDNIVGDAFGSSANSLSYNMDVLDRTEDTPS